MPDTAFRRDPTDLLTLPVLWFSWRLWTRLHGPQRPLPRRAWLALPLAALSNSGPPDPGISCLAAEQGRVFAVTSWGASLSYHGSFVSDDGGLTWQEADSAEVAAIKCQPPHRLSGFGPALIELVAGDQILHLLGQSGQVLGCFLRLPGRGQAL